MTHEPSNTAVEASAATLLRDNAEVAEALGRRYEAGFVTDIETTSLPPGLDPKTHAQIRPYDGIVPPGMEWQNAFAEGLRCKW